MRSFRMQVIHIVPAFIILTPPNIVEAYLDPGTGSIIIQVVIGVAVGGLVTVKIFWSRIKTFLKSLFSRGKKIEGAED